VLSEYFVTVTAKLVPGLSRGEAWADVVHLFAWDPLPLGSALLEHARRVQEDFRLSWWDALIVAAGQRCGCAYLLTEDLQNHQDLAGLTVLDPFQHDPAEILGSV
jgi:predicted nucleic acid-binding protein